jgi:phospholipid/cholesterol/gamma-HCH transport system substrate-binding protein
MKKYSMETSVGIFVLIGLLAVGYLTVQLGKMELLGGDYYILHARFNNVQGLKSGSFVNMAGVQIGQVADISLEVDRAIAIVDLKIDKKVPIDDFAIASIKTSGLIGDKYIKITPGGSGEYLKPGDTITDTESAIDLEELISKYIFGGV